MRRFVTLRLLILLIFLGVAGISIVPSIAKIAEFPVPEWIAKTFPNTFKLGLDLQGGLHLEYSVAVDEAIRNNLDRVAAELEDSFRTKKEIEVRAEREGTDTLVLKFARPEDIDLATPDVLAVASDVVERVPEESDGEERRTSSIRLKMSSLAINENRDAILSQAKETVERRVDAMGVAEPSIYTKNRQVVVELPGVSDQVTEIAAATDDAGNRLAEAIRKAGGKNISRLPAAGDPGAFRLTVADSQLSGLLKKALSRDWSFGQPARDDVVGVELMLEPVMDAAGKQDLSSGIFRLTETAREDVLADSSDFRRLLRVIERSAVLEMHLVDDEPISAEGKAFDGKPYIRALYEGKLIHRGMGISVNRLSDYSSDKAPGVTVKAPHVLFAKDRRTLEQFFANLPEKWRLPSTHKVAYEQQPLPMGRGKEPVVAWRTHVIRSRADVTGDRIVSASVGFEPGTSVPQVNVKFDRLGGQLFDKMSGDNVGRRMAIIMDDQVVSDPVFSQRIPNGSVVINLGSGEGKGVREQANDLVKVLKSGSLPARLNKEFEIRLGADLGHDAVVSGFQAFVYGLLTVVLFMMVYYRKSGIIAVLALVMNMVAVLAAMALFGATLTLPGIAGMVLTIGMAVDANVLIFERIRECLRDGYTPRAAIEAGYDRAFSTILDSQLTTAIAGFVLWQYGSGPIKGFAITLLIGIVTSIVTGVFGTRIFFDVQANRRGFDRISI